MGEVVSRDGTRIAFDRTGSGDPVILVDGALCYRASGPSRPLAKHLAQRFTVYTYDRRGRGESGDTAPYAVEREVEDLGALIAEAGGSACVYGASSGGALALEAAKALPGIKKLAVYEVPFIVDDTRAPFPPDYTARLSELIAAGRRTEAVKYFMTTGIGMPRILVSLMRLSPVWSKVRAVAHTLPYDASVLGAETVAGNPLPADRWASITVPTLVLCGGKSPDWLRNSGDACARVLGAQHHTLTGQTHMVKPQILAPVLAAFFSGESDQAHARRAAVPSTIAPTKK
jgi:pimeloyl-ACP methyl ester carboxylesterase